MSRKRFTALIAAACTLAGCAAPPATRYEPRTSAQLGTVAPAYPVGDLADGVEVLGAIPVTDLSTTEPIPVDVNNLCAGVPAEVATSAGLTATPIPGDYDCIWRGPDLGLEIVAMRYSTKEQIEEHRATSTGESEPLAHLAWLRVNGHYATERILEFDPNKGCTPQLDMSSTAILNVLVYRFDPATEDAVKTDTATSVRTICPVTRKIADNLINHLDDDQDIEWWESVINPVG